MSQHPLLDTMAPIVTPRTDWASAIVDNADRLGLKWDLRFGTVVSNTFTDPGINSTGNNVAVTLDGDTATIACVPLAGLNSIGARVAVIKMPPAGNFVIGCPATPASASQLISRTRLDGTGVTGIGTGSTSVPGMSTTLTVVGGFDWECEAFFDFNVTTGGATSVFAQLTSPNGTEASLPIFGIPTTGLRATVGQLWSGTATGGVTTFSFIVRKSLALGAVDLVAARALIRIYQ